MNSSSNDLYEKIGNLYKIWRRPKLSESDFIDVTDFMRSLPDLEKYT